MCCKSGWKKAEEIGRNSRNEEVARLTLELSQAQAREMALRAALAKAAADLDYLASTPPTQYEAWFAEKAADKARDVLRRAKEIDNAG